MTNNEPEPAKPMRRIVVQATCTVHGGARNYTNLVVRVLDGHIELDPHANKSCTLVLDEDAANALFVFLGAWL